MPATADKKHLPASSYRERTELILGELDQLPALPAVVARLVTLTTTPDSSIKEITEVIESDASMTAAILRLVHRADLGVRTEGMTVSRAVKSLGVNAVRNTALSSRIYDALSRPHDNEHTAQFHRELWKHSFAVACAADLLAVEADRRDVSGQAFVCGLLHDIGKVALDACLPKSYARVIDRVDRHRDCICNVEQEVLGIDHTVAGRHLATRWHLSRSIIECAWLHHQDPGALPSSVTEPRLIQLVHLADNVVRRHRIGYSGYQYLCDVEAVADDLGIEPHSIQSVVERLPERMEPLCELVGLEDAIGRTLYVQSLTKANKELVSVNEQLTEANRALKARSACFDAVQLFTKRLTEHDRIGDVCAAAAGSIAVLFEVDRAIVFVTDAAGPHLHVSAYEPGGAPRTSVNKLDDLQNLDLLVAATRETNGHGLVSAPEGCDAMWQRFMKSEVPEVLWMLPLIENTHFTGAALLAGDPNRPGHRALSQHLCHPLATAVALAIATAKARADAERLNDEVLDLNRRCRESQRELVRARSVSMIAQMAAGAAHELNNPLSVIRGRAQMQLKICGDPELAEPLEIIVEQAREASEILTELMHFAKPDLPKPAREELQGMLESHCQRWCIDSGFGREQVHLSIADPEATVYADPDQLREMLNAILTNAVEAGSSESIQLQINSPSRASDETVLITVEDNGAGMSAETLEHAFDPFFSSRPAGRGRGLGLSRAYRFAEINGGRLWLDSSPNVGTKVTIELPARAPAP